jgi:hypothetical protein
MAQILRFMVQVLMYRIQGSGLRTQGSESGCSAPGLGFGVFWFVVCFLCFRVCGFEFRIRVSGR